MAKTLLFFQMLILRWILQFDLAEHIKIIPIMDARGAGRGLRAGVGITRGAGKFALRHAGRAAIAAAAIAAATAVITRGDGCCCRGNHRRGGYRCGDRDCR